MLIKLEAEIEIDDDELESWIATHPSIDSREGVVDEMEGLEFRDAVSGLGCMFRFHSAKEA